jgi:hypothetical protein
MCKDDEKYTTENIFLYICGQCGKDYKFTQLTNTHCCNMTNIVLKVNATLTHFHSFFLTKVIIFSIQHMISNKFILQTNTFRLHFCFGWEDRPGYQNTELFCLALCILNTCIDIYNFNTVKYNAII